MIPRYGWQGRYIRGLDITREPAECPTCGASLEEGCDHSPKPEPESFGPPEHGWGAPPDPSKPPATMEPHPF